MREFVIIFNMRVSKNVNIKENGNDKISYRNEKNSIVNFKWILCKIINIIVFISCRIVSYRYIGRFIYYR